MLAARRQRGRCGARHCHRAHGRRAVQQRPRQRPLRDRLGRPRTRRPERIGPRTGRVDARTLRRQCSAMPERGWEAVTIPGAVSGWAALSQRYGKLPFARPVRAGDPLCPRRLRRVARRRRKMGASPSPVLPQGPRFRRALSAAWPCAARRRALRVRPRWPTRWTRSRRRTANAFYRGDLAAAMVAHSQSHGGAHTLADFAAHTLDWVTPLAQDYRGYTVHEIPPNGQGIAALMALGIARASFDLAAPAADSVAVPASADRGDEARVRRCLSLRQRSAHDGGHAPPRCSTAIISRRAHASSIRSARRISARASHRAAARSICAPPTRAA